MIGELILGIALIFLAGVVLGVALCQKKIRRLEKTIFELSSFPPKIIERSGWQSPPYPWLPDTQFVPPTKEELARMR